MSQNYADIGRKLKWLAVANMVIGVGTLAASFYLTLMGDALENAELMRSIFYPAAAAVVILTLLRAVTLNSGPTLHGISAPSQAEPSNARSKAFGALAFANAGTNFVLLAGILGMFVTEIFPRSTSNWIVLFTLFVVGTLLMLRVTLLFSGQKK